MPLYADLYLDRIDLTRHLDKETCQVCRVDSLAELLDRLRSGQLCGGQCPHWPRERVEAFRMAINAGKALPTIPSLNVPSPTQAGLLELNGPTAVSPVLVTGNSRLTHEVLLAVLSTTTAPMWMASVDTGGHTVDMSLSTRRSRPRPLPRPFRPTPHEPMIWRGESSCPAWPKGSRHPCPKCSTAPSRPAPSAPPSCPCFSARTGRVDWNLVPAGSSSSGDAKLSLKLGMYAEEPIAGKITLRARLNTADPHQACYRARKAAAGLADTF